MWDLEKVGEKEQKRKWDGDGDGDGVRQTGKGGERGFKGRGVGGVPLN